MKPDANAFVKLEFSVGHIEPLPEIRMRVNVEPIACLKRLDRIARANKALEVGSNLQNDGDLHCNVVYISSRTECEHEGLYAMFVQWKHDGKSLQLQAAAHRWDPDPPTYDCYVAAARRLLQPVIDAYNLKFKTRHRMRIETREELQPRMTPAAEKAFYQFVTTANKLALHPLDWEEFYRFVTVCRRTRLHLYEDEIRWFCRRAGFSPEQTSNLTVAYLHCSHFYDWLCHSRR